VGTAQQLDFRTRSIRLKPNIPQGCGGIVEHLQVTVGIAERGDGRRPNPLSGNAVDVRRLIAHQPSGKHTEVTLPDVITPDDDDVGALGSDLFAKMN